MSVYMNSKVGVRNSMYHLRSKYFLEHARSFYQPLLTALTSKFIKTLRKRKLLVLSLRSAFCKLFISVCLQSSTMSSVSSCSCWSLPKSHHNQFAVRAVVSSLPQTSPRTNATNWIANRLDQLCRARYSGTVFNSPLSTETVMVRILSARRVFLAIQTTVR